MNASTLFTERLKTSVRSLIGLATIGVLALAASGCVSSRYKLADVPDTRPALDLTPAPADLPVKATLRSVTVIRGPGSWKREAYWDEYRVTVSNGGVAPISIERVILANELATYPAHTQSPWVLEQQSLALQDRRFGFGRDVLLQVGGGAATVAVVAGAGAAAFSGAALVGAGGGAIAGGIVAVPLFVGGSIYANVSSRWAVEREFTRRRLVTPLILAPERVTTGSFFFPITPSPRRLTLHYRVDDQPGEAVIELSPLAGLHLQGPPPPAPVTQ